MSAQEIPPPFVLYRMMTGFYLSQAIHVVARLGIADLLSNVSSTTGPTNVPLRS
jgi:hypothetical protein